MIAGFAIPNPLFDTQDARDATVHRAYRMRNKFTKPTPLDADDIAFVRALMESHPTPPAMVATDYLFHVAWASPYATGLSLIESAGLVSTQKFGFHASTLTSLHANHTAAFAAWILSQKPNPLDDFDTVQFEMKVDWNAHIVKAWTDGDIHALTDALNKR